MRVNGDAGSPHQPVGCSQKVRFVERDVPVPVSSLPCTCRVARGSARHSPAGSGGERQGPVFNHDVRDAVEILLVVRDQNHSERDRMGGNLPVVGAAPTRCRGLDSSERLRRTFVERHHADRGENGRGIPSHQVGATAFRKPDFELPESDRRHDEIAGFAPIEAPIQVFASAENRNVNTSVCTYAGARRPRRIRCASNAPEGQTNQPGDLRSADQLTPAPFTPCAGASSP